MVLPMKKLKGQIPTNNLTDEKDNYNGIDDNTAKVFLVDAIYIYMLGSGLSMNYLNLHNNSEEYITTIPKKKQT